MKKKFMLTAVLMLIMAQTAQAAEFGSFFMEMTKAAVQKISIISQESIKNAGNNTDDTDDDINEVKSVDEIVTVVDIRLAALKDGSDVYEIEYAKKGMLASKTLIANTDCVVSGAKNDINELSCGDLIIIDTVYDDTVDYITVVMSLDNVRFDRQPFDSQIFVPNRAAWYKYGEKKNAKHEVYFGYILKAESDGGKMKILMNSGDGKTDSSSYFTIDEKTNVYIYNSYANSSSAKFKTGEIYDIEASIYPKDNEGNVDFESENFIFDDMKSAFIYINHGDIVNITLVNYTK